MELNIQYGDKTQNNVSISLAIDKDKELSKEQEKELNKLLINTSHAMLRIILNAENERI